MFARVTIGQVRLGKLDETIGLIGERLYPALKQQKGFKGALLLTSADTEKFIGITLWETEADIPHISSPAADTDIETGTQRRPTRRFFEATPQERRATIPLAGQPTREIYEVSVQV